MFERVIVLPRVSERHPDITEADVLAAVKMACSVRRRDFELPSHYSMAGVDTKGRMIEIVGAEREDGALIVYHAMKLTNKNGRRARIMMGAKVEYKMKGGTILTDEDFDRLGEACERGEYPGAAGEWVVRPQGRPTLCDEELVTIAVKVPRSQLDAIDRRAREAHESRSQFVRDALQAALVV